ncbi:MAG: DNA replication/repair protein RecF [Acutalibacteraceae bacterium]
MKVNSLKTENFRNLEDTFFIPHKRINVIHGENAQGKTNLLEAIWLFCGGHSFRGAKETEFVKFGEEFSKLHMEFFSEERDQNADIIYKGNKKEVKINGVSKKTGSALIEKFSCVVFSPEHLSLIKSGPSQRRRFIDSALSRESIKYALFLAKYNQNLNERNALLKDIGKHRELISTLDIWDESLIYYGSQILYLRNRYIKKLKEEVNLYHKGISKEKEELSFKYISTIESDEEDSVEIISDKYKKALEKSRNNDMYYGSTTIGIHRDDLDIEINGLKAKIYGSQGQIRSIVLSLKLAEAKILSMELSENPVILFDDVMSELDRNRQEYLLSNINDYQVFITCCENFDDNFIKNGKSFLISKGKIL